MDIASGLSALKSGFDISRTINQRIKEGKSYPNEIADQLLQLQQLMLDSQRALNDAAEEIRTLKEEIAALKETEKIEQDLEWVEDGGFWVRKSEKSSGTAICYCPLCWGDGKKLVPLNPVSGKGVFRCALHDSSHETQAYRNYVRQQSQQLSGWAARLKQCDLTSLAAMAFRHRRCLLG